MSGYLQPAHYVLYWKLTPEERVNLAATRSAAYAASPHLARVKPGDVLWLVNIHIGRLLLIGRILVETVVDHIEIAQDLVGAYPGDWIEADWYAIANRHRVEPLREVDITPAAALLRFASRTQDTLLLTADQRIDANQFRALRRLTEDSGRMLEDIWYSDEYVPTTAQDFLELTEDDAAYAEGKIVVRTLRQRHRNRSLVETARLRYRQQHGHLFCQVCGFDFAAVYGIDYIEAHHLRQMAVLDEDHVSRVEDLAMLCANCHRMAHQRTPPYTPEELQALMAARRRDSYRSAPGGGYPDERDDHSAGD
jgi:hypothetical protein